MKRITCGLVLGLVLSLCGVVLPSAKVTAEGTGVALSDYVQTIEKNGIDTIDPYGGGNLMFSQSGTHPVSGKTDSIGEGDNQETTVTFKNPVYLADNGTETPFVSFSLFSKNQTNRDIDAIIFTLIDVENAENHISVMLGLWDDSNGNKGIMYAKGSGQKFVGYHHTGNGARSWNYPDSQGTLLARNGIGKNLLETIGFYYDYATQKVYCDMYWASYESRGQVFGGKVLIRDLSEELPGYEAAYTQGIERAYLKITTVKGWNLYTDEYGETSNFRHLVGVKHTAMGPISDSGAQYLLRTIDGQDLKTEADGKTITDNGKISGYRAKTENVGTPGEHIVPALMGHSVLRGEIEDKAYTSSLYLQSSGGTLSGTESGKWTENTKLNLIADGTYTVGYYTDAECTQKVAEYTVKLEKEYGKIDSVSVSLDGTVGLNVYVKTADAYDSLQAQAGFAGEEKSSVNGVYIGEENLWKFTYRVAAKDYKKKVEMSITLLDNKTLTATVSVEDYAKQIPDENAAYAVVQSMLKYCESARAYFANETVTADETDISANIENFKPIVSGMDADIALDGVTLVLESGTKMNIYFSGNTTGKSFSVNGVTVQPQASGYSENENKFVISVDAIAAKDLGKVHTFSVGGYELKASALSYAYLVNAQSGASTAWQNVVKALYEYYVASAAYFA